MRESGSLKRFSFRANKSLKNSVPLFYIWWVIYTLNGLRAKALPIIGRLVLCAITQLTALHMAVIYTRVSKAAVKRINFALWNHYVTQPARRLISQRRERDWNNSLTRRMNNSLPTWFHNLNFHPLVSENFFLVHLSSPRFDRGFWESHRHILQSSNYFVSCLVSRSEKKERSRIKSSSLPVLVTLSTCNSIRPDLGVQHVPLYMCLCWRKCFA